MRTRILGGGAIVLAIALALFWTQWLVPTRNAVAIGTSMLAKQMCSCVFVAGRSQADCRADQFSSMDAISLELDRSTRQVRAFVTGLGERSAAFSEDLGCTLR
jgi:hypothetical protein